MKLSYKVQNLLVASAFILSANSGLTSVEILKETYQKGPFQLAKGTGDSGGGNALNYKMLESYIIDPTELEIAREIVLPALVNSQRNEKTMAFAEESSSKTEADAEAEALQSAKDFFKIKTWYLAPIELKTLPKEVLGVEFALSELQQIAIQTENEVWIDSRLFEKMSREEQARLIMHEVVMTMYLFNFATIDEVCELVQKIQVNKPVDDQFDTCSNPGLKKAFERIHKPQPKRKLNGNDYNAIREATAFALKNSEILNEGLWKRKLKSLGFTSLITHENHSFSSGSEKKSREEIRKYFEIARVTNKLPKLCHLRSADSDLVRSCSLEFEFSNSDQSSNLTVRLTNPEIGLNGVYSAYLSDEQPITSEVTGKIKKWSVVLGSASRKADPIGSKNIWLEIIIKNDELFEVAIMQTKLAYSRSFTKTENGSNYNCTEQHYRNFISSNANDMHIFATRSTSEPESSFSYFTESFTSSPVTFCEIAPN